MGNFELGGITDPQLQRNFQTLERLLPNTGGLSLRIRSGSVTSAGAVASGTGFTVTKGAAGLYTVNVGFSIAPVVLITPIVTAARAATVTAASTTSFGVSIFTTTTGASIDTAFFWLAIGS